MDGHHQNSGFNFKSKENASNASPTTDNNSSSDRSQEWITDFAPKTKRLNKFRHELLKEHNLKKPQIRKEIYSKKSFLFNCSHHSKIKTSTRRNEKSSNDY